jgi:hypothetical protein
MLHCPLILGNINLLKLVEPESLAKEPQGSGVLCSGTQIKSAGANLVILRPLSAWEKQI